MFQRIKFYKKEADRIFYNKFSENIIHFLLTYFLVIGALSFTKIVEDVILEYTDTDFHNCFSIISSLLLAAFFIPLFFDYARWCYKQDEGQNSAYFEVFSSKQLYLKSFKCIFHPLKIFSYISDTEKNYHVSFFERILLFVSYIPIFLVSYFTFGILLVFGFNLYIYSAIELNKYYAAKSKISHITLESFEEAENL